MGVIGSHLPSSRNSSTWQNPPRPFDERHSAISSPLKPGYMSRDIPSANSMSMKSGTFPGINWLRFHRNVVNECTINPCASITSFELINSNKQYPLENGWMGNRRSSNGGNTITPLSIRDQPLAPLKVGAGIVLSSVVEVLERPFLVHGQRQLWDDTTPIFLSPTRRPSPANRTEIIQPYQTPISHDGHPSYMSLDNQYNDDEADSSYDSSLKGDIEPSS